MSLNIRYERVKYFPCAFALVHYLSPMMDRHRPFLQDVHVKNHEQGIAKCYVGLHERDIVAYYTLSASYLDREWIPESADTKLPNYPIPPILIGKFAVDQRMMGQGVGKQLLKDAFNRITSVSEIIGAYFIEVDPYDDQAKRFWIHFGFTALPDHPDKMLLRIAAVRQAQQG